MTATAYSVMIPLIRAAIGDIGATLTLCLLRFSEYTGDSEGATITPAIANDNDKGAIACYVALILVLPGGTFSLDTPNMKYWVQSNKELISHLLNQIAYFLNEGDVRPSIWGALDQLYNEGILISDRLVEAVGAV